MKLDINKYKINSSESIISALNRLNELKDISRLILFVVDDSEKVIGSLTDGDIRRNLIKYNDLSINLKDVCNSKFHFIIDSTNYIDFSSFLDEDILIIPVLNDKFQLVELIDHI